MKPLLLALSLALAAHADLRGTVVDCHDGDTVKIRTEAGLVRVRLQNIDAPELKQAGGRESRDHLRHLAPLGQLVVVQTDGEDKYHRTLGTVWRGSQNLNLTMVRDGQAWTYRKYCSDPVYLGAEASARRAHLGLWADSVAMAPWEWRHQPKRPVVK